MKNFINVTVLFCTFLIAEKGFTQESELTKIPHQQECEDLFGKSYFKIVDNVNAVTKVVFQENKKRIDSKINANGKSLDLATIAKLAKNHGHIDELSNRLLTELENTLRLFCDSVESAYRLHQ